MYIFFLSVFFNRHKKTPILNHAKRKKGPNEYAGKISAG
jgi:hypothetical protein